MEEQRRISLNDLVVGEPLPWDVYGTGNKLLLRRGHVLDSARQAEDLVARGVFIDGGQAERDRQARLDALEAARREAPSALRLINESVARLGRLLYNLGNEADPGSRIAEIGAAINAALDINTDVALASIQLNRESGTYAVRHAVDTAILALLVARAMRRDEAERRSLVAAALTMNVGMLRFQDHLQGKVEPLSEAERADVRGHTEESARLLAAAGIDDPLWLACVQMHHDDPDGSGYPLGARVTDIPEAARILAMADRYCAAVSLRAYRKTLLPGPALRDVLMRGGKTSEPVLAAHLIKELGTSPPGTLVRLADGEIGVVTRRASSTSAPVVHAFIGPRGSPLSFPIKRDTGKPLHAIREVLPSDHAVLRFPLQQLWGSEAAP